MNPNLDRHERLLNEWAGLPHHQGKGFVRDGIIDPDRWEKAPRKVLFFLREAHNEGKDWDLRDVIRTDWNGPKYKIWWTAAAWAYAVHHGTPHRVPPYPSTSESWDLARVALLSSATVNIKKRSGKSASDIRDLTSYVASDGRLLRQQIELIGPDVVICGSVWSLVRDLWPETRVAYDLARRVGHCVFIDFWHPANQLPNQLNYYALAAILHGAGVLGVCAGGDAS